LPRIATLDELLAAHGRRIEHGGMGGSDSASAAANKITRVGFTTISFAKNIRSMLGFPKAAPAWIGALIVNET
jgi:hypothetical protein